MNERCRSANQPALEKVIDIIVNYQYLFTTSIFTMVNCTSVTSVAIEYKPLRGKEELTNALVEKSQDKCLESTKCSFNQLRNHTLRFGVKGSGSLMFRGKALRMRFRIWMQLGGMTSQKLKW